MIRINLLPISEADRIEDGKQVFLILFMMAVITSIGFLYYKNQVVGELESQQSQLSRLKRQQRELDEKIQESKRLEEELNEITTEVNREQEVINDLTRNQISPAGLLSELSYLMSPPKSYTERENFTQKGWQWNWETGGIWLNHFKETDRKLKIIGLTRTIDDVGEFLTRLNGSPYFVKTTLKQTESEKITFPNGYKAVFTRFEIETQIVYGVSDLKRLFEQAGEPIPGRKSARLN